MPKIIKPKEDINQRNAAKGGGPQKSGFAVPQGEIIQTQEAEGIKIQLISGGLWGCPDHPELGKFTTLEDAERILKKGKSI